MQYKAHSFDYQVTFHTHGGGRARNSDQFVRLLKDSLRVYNSLLYSRFRSRNIFRAIAKKQVSKCTHTYFSLEVKMVQILMDLNLNEAVKTSGYCIKSESRALPPPWHSSFQTPCSGGSRISPRWVRQPSVGLLTYDFAKISQKLHEIERI